MALSRDELEEVLRKRVVLAVRPEEARGVVDRPRGKERLRRRALRVLAEVDALQPPLLVVVVVAVAPTREVLLDRRRQAARAAAADLPWEDAVGDAHDVLVRLVRVVHVQERKHRRIRLGVLASEGQAVRHVRLHVARRPEEGRVAAGDVARAHDVAQHAHVLRLRDRRLRVASVVPLDRLHGRVGLPNITNDIH